MIDTLISAIDDAIAYLLFWAVFYPTGRFAVWLASTSTTLKPDKRGAIDLIDRISKAALVVGHEMAIELHEEEIRRTAKGLGIEVPEL